MYNSYKDKKMTDKQIEALFTWLNAHAYSGEPGTDGAYLRMEEMQDYLPDAIKKITAKTKE